MQYLLNDVRHQAIKAHMDRAWNHRNVGLMAPQQKAIIEINT